MQIAGSSHFFFTMVLKVRLQGEHALQCCPCASRGGCSLVSEKGSADKDTDESAWLLHVALWPHGPCEQRRSAESRAPLHSPGRGDGKDPVSLCFFAGARPASEGQRRPSANPILVPRASPALPRGCSLAACGREAPAPVGGAPGPRCRCRRAPGLARKPSASPQVIRAPSRHFNK